jgi:hypothetical protein
MVDSRQKGARGEYLVRDMLRVHKGYQFERIHKDSPLSDKIFTQPKTNNLIQWWRKLCTQAKHMKQEPLLFFKYNRSKVFVVTALEPKCVDEYMYISWLNCYILLAERWLTEEGEDFLHGQPSS